MCGSSHRVPEKEITARSAESVARPNGSLDAPERFKVLKYMELRFRLAQDLVQDLGLSERIWDTPKGFCEIWDELRDFEVIWKDLGRSGRILKGSGRI